MPRRRDPNEKPRRRMRTIRVWVEYKGQWRVMSKRFLSGDGFTKQDWQRAYRNRMNQIKQHRLRCEKLGVEPGKETI